jgi:phage gp36-like protein
MAYTTRAKINAIVPAAVLLQCLDDDGNAVEDTGLFDTIVAAAQEKIDAILDGACSVPFADGSVPAAVQEACKVFVLDLLYRRKGNADSANPWAGQAKLWEERLWRIAAGELPIDSDDAAARLAAGGIEDLSDEDEFDPTSQSGL